MELVTVGVLGILWRHGEKRQGGDPRTFTETMSAAYASYG
jgi:hypothetical protein